MSGDKFVILCDQNDASSAERDVTHLARRVADLLSAPFLISGISIRFSASVGLATRRLTEPAGSVLNRADRALLDAQAAGKARWVKAPEVVEADEQSASEA